MMEQQVAVRGSSPDAVTFQAECVLCKGTGVHRRTHDLKGAAFVCYICHGSGELTLEIPQMFRHYWDYEPFRGRQTAVGVHWVYARRGIQFVNDKPVCIPSGTPVSYEEFQTGKMPTAKSFTRH